MILPSFLTKGDRASIIAPSGNLRNVEIKLGIDILNQWGLKVIESPGLLENYRYLAGEDKKRLKFVQESLDDPSIKAIFCARGGYGLARIIDSICLKSFKRNPKWIIGFSDITHLHLKLHINSYMSLHGQTLSYFNNNRNKSILKLKKILFGKVINYSINNHSLNKKGYCTSRLIGGNLRTIIDTIGTSTNIDFNNKILFIEETSEYYYSIDRMITYLKRTGILGCIGGLIIGSINNMKDKKTHRGLSNPYQIISESIQEYDYPAIFRFPAGHRKKNMPIILGHQCTIKVNSNKANLLFT